MDDKRIDRMRAYGRDTDIIETITATGQHHREWRQNTMILLGETAQVSYEQQFDTAYGPWLLDQWADLRPM